MQSATQKRAKFGRGKIRVLNVDGSLQKAISFGWESDKAS
jgi:hypothetical protein